MNQRTLYETARYVGSKTRAVARMDREAQKADGFSFNINVLLGGQIAGQRHEIHSVYPQGNSLQASTASPFLQIGEFKYGKPILDRGFQYETKLSDAVKFGMLSMEATIKSNVSVGPPIDLFAYERDSLEVKLPLPDRGERSLLSRHPVQMEREESSSSWRPCQSCDFQMSWGSRGKRTRERERHSRQGENLRPHQPRECAGGDRAGRRRAGLQLGAPAPNAMWRWIAKRNGSGAAIFRHPRGRARERFARRSPAGRRSPRHRHRAIPR